MLRRETRDRRDYQPQVKPITLQIASKRLVLAEVRAELAAETNPSSRRLRDLEIIALETNLAILSKKQIENESLSQEAESRGKTLLRDDSGDYQNAA